MGTPRLLSGGLVADGSGGPLYAADVLVADGLTWLVDPGEDRGGLERIDVSERVIAPGFIDVHTHSDALGLDDRTDPALALASVRQGVTVEIAGNCGYSLFPCWSGGDGPSDQMRSFVGAIHGAAAEPLASHSAFERRTGRTSRRNHLASLVGHANLRGAVVGFDDRVATPEELATMCALLDRELRAGAVGMSSGLIYPPGSYAGTDELVALATVLAPYGRPYVTHLRDEMANVEAALEEAIAIATRAGVPLHVSHHKTAGRYAWGKTHTTLSRMDEARAGGLDLTCDVYPYTAASTHLHAMLPPWANEGGIRALLERLRSGPAVRENIRRSIHAGEPGWENTVGNGGWDRVEIAVAPGHRSYEGRSVADLAADAGQDPVDFVCGVLVAEDAKVMIISRSMVEEDVQRVLTHPGTIIGSDGVPQEGRPHPRWAGTFARVLGRYTRDEGLLTVADAISRMTGLPARRFGLEGRGAIRNGSVADLVVFDPATVGDRATFEQPLLPPTGIERVIVDGHDVVRDGEPTTATPGRLLRVDASAVRRERA